MSKEQKYFIYVYAEDADCVYPPIHGKMDNEEYDSLEIAKQAMMKKDLTRFQEFEIITLCVKDQNSNLNDKNDCYASIPIKKLTPAEQEHYNKLAIERNKQRKELAKAKKHLNNYTNCGVKNKK